MQPIKRSEVMTTELMNVITALLDHLGLKLEALTYADHVVYNIVPGETNANATDNSTTAVDAPKRDAKPRAKRRPARSKR